MHDLCERTCPECDGPMAEPYERNPISLRDKRTRICANCQIDQIMKEIK